MRNYVFIKILFLQLEEDELHAVVVIIFKNIFMNSNDFVTVATVAKKIVPKKVFITLEIVLAFTKSEILNPSSSR